MLKQIWEFFKEVSAFLVLTFILAAFGRRLAVYVDPVWIVVFLGVIVFAGMWLAILRAHRRGDLNIKRPD